MRKSNVYFSQVCAVHTHVSFSHTCRDGNCGAGVEEVTPVSVVFVVAVVASFSCACLTATAALVVVIHSCGGDNDGGSGCCCGGGGESVALHEHPNVSLNAHDVLHSCALHHSPKRRSGHVTFSTQGTCGARALK
jgi:hypothetical protein